MQAGIARVQLRLVAVTARITTELEELKRAANSPSLWKLHVDSVIALLEVSRSTGENADRVLALANQHGSREEMNALTNSMQKLFACSSLAIDTLGGISHEKSGVSQEKSVGASTSI